MDENYPDSSLLVPYVDPLSDFGLDTNTSEIPSSVAITELNSLYCNEQASFVPKKKKKIYNYNYWYEIRSDFYEEKLGWFIKVYIRPDKWFDGEELNFVELNDKKQFPKIFTKKRFYLLKLKFGDKKNFDYINNINIGLFEYDRKTQKVAFVNDGIEIKPKFIFNWTKNELYIKMRFNTTTYMRCSDLFLLRVLNNNKVIVDSQMFKVISIMSKREFFSHWTTKKET